MSSQILTQAEITALLESLSQGKVEVQAPEEKELDGVKKIDLAGQERIIRGRMPGMELIHERFARSFRRTLSQQLSRNCFINVGGVEMEKFGPLIKRLPLPSSLHIYRMPPLPGHALVVASTPLVYAIVDCMFGGSGLKKVKTEGREFSAIENRLIGKVVIAALEELKEAWAPLHPVDFVYVRSEFNPLAVSIVPSTDMVVAVTMDVELEQDNATLMFCTPYATIEPIKQKLTTGFQSNRLECGSNTQERMAKNLKQASVNVKTTMARGKIKARDLLLLKVGDTIPLSTSPREEAIVSVEGAPKFKAAVGKHHGSKAARITGVLKPEDRK